MRSNPSLCQTRKELYIYPEILRTKEKPNVQETDVNDNDDMFAAKSYFTWFMNKSILRKRIKTD